jgi:predicted RNase H-like HicB family nuclease
MKITDKQYTFRVIFESDEDGYHGYVPSLPGCHTWGKTLKEVKKNIREAIKSYVGSLTKHGEEVPSDTGFETFEVFSPNDFNSP